MVWSCYSIILIITRGKSFVWKDNAIKRHNNCHLAPFPNFLARLHGPSPHQPIFIFVEDLHYHTTLKVEQLHTLTWHAWSDKEIANDGRHKYKKPKQRKKSLSSCQNNLNALIASFSLWFLFWNLPLFSFIFKRW